MNDSNVRGLKWNLKKIRKSVLHFSPPQTWLATFMPHLGFSGPEKKMMGTPNPTRPHLSFIKIKKKKNLFEERNFY